MIFFYVEFLVVVAVVVDVLCFLAGGGGSDEQQQRPHYPNPKILSACGHKGNDVNSQAAAAACRKARPGEPCSNGRTVVSVCVSTLCDCV